MRPLSPFVLLTTCVLLLHGTLAVAQDPGTNELGLSVGFGTSNELLNVFEDALSTTLLVGTVTTEEAKVGPALGISYRRALKQRWKINGDVQYQRITENILLNEMPAGTVDHSFITVGVGSDYRYVYKSHFQMYSGVAAAWTFQRSSTNDAEGISAENSNFFNFQVIAVGVRVGGTWAGVAELGFGYKGLLSVGLSRSF